MKVSVICDRHRTRSRTRTLGNTPSRFVFPAMATTSDLNLLRRKLAAEDYDPERYVQELAGRCVGGHELQVQKKAIVVSSQRMISFNDLSSNPFDLQTLEEGTHSLLKQNVYQNFGQFIETAKEISFLEGRLCLLSVLRLLTLNLVVVGEMYQLSNLLQEQKHILTDLSKTSVIGQEPIVQDAEVTAPAAENEAGKNEAGQEEKEKK